MLAGPHPRSPSLGRFAPRSGRRRCPESRVPIYYNPPMHVTRRGFLETAAAGVALSALAGRRIVRAQPSDQIVLGMIGVGGMGMSRLRGFLQHPDVRIGAICDVDRSHVDQAVAAVE